MIKKPDSTLRKIVSFWQKYFPGLVPVFVLAHLMHHIPGFIIQPLLPAIRDNLHLDYSQIGWLTGAYSLAYGLSNLPAGWLGGRIAPRILITIGVAGVAACGLLVGLAGFIPSYLIMVIAMLLMGILGGGYHPSASPMLADTIPQAQRGRALGVHQIGGTLANIIVPLLAASLVFLAWQWFFILFTIPIMIYGIYLYRVLKRQNVGDIPRKLSATVVNNTVKPRGYLRRLIAFVTLGTAVQVFVFSTLSFVTLMVVDELGGPPWLGMLLLATGHLAGLVAGPAGGSISDRIGKVPVMLVVGLAAGPLIYILSLVHYWWVLPLILLGLGSCMYVAMPVSEAYVIGKLSPGNRSSVLGIYYAASRGGPGVLTPIIGRLIDQHNFGTAFTVTGATMFVIALTCALLLWGTKE